MVERTQHGGGIGRPTTKPTAHRDAFFDADIRALTAVGSFLQHDRCTNHEVVGLIHALGTTTNTRNDAVGTGPQVDDIAPVEQPEYRLQCVVAIRTATRDPQEQVQLGRCGPLAPALGRREVSHARAQSALQRSTTRRTRSWSRSAVTRPGNSTPLPASSRHSLYSMVQPACSIRCACPSVP